MTTINYSSSIAIERFTSGSNGIVKTESLFPLLDGMRKDSTSYFHLLPRDIVEYILSPYFFSAKLQNPARIDDDIEKNISLLRDECDAISSIAIVLIGNIKTQNNKCQNSLKLVRAYTSIFFDLIMQLQIKYDKTIIDLSSTRIGGEITTPLGLAKRRFELAYSTAEINQLINDLDLVPDNTSKANEAVEYVHVYISHFRMRRLLFKLFDNFDIDRSLLTVRTN